MSTVSAQKTYTTKLTDIDRKWLVVDATGQKVGRLASEIAKILRGKHKVIFSPHMDTGDFVVVINAEKIELSGNKAEQKVYYRHSGYLGGLKKKTVAKVMEQNPEEVLWRAVKGMLPHNKLQKPCLKKLKVYAGSEHPHSAQNPQLIQIGG